MLRHPVPISLIVSFALLAVAAAQEDELYPHTRERGRAAVEYDDDEIHIVAAYYHSQRHHDSPWLLIEAAVSAKRVMDIHRDEIRLVLSARVRASIISWGQLDWAHPWPPPLRPPSGIGPQFRGADPTGCWITAVSWVLAEHTMLGLAEVLVVSVIVLLMFVFGRRGGPSSRRTTLKRPKRGSMSGKTILVVIIAGAVTGVIARVTGDWMGVVSGGMVEGAIGGGVAGAVAVFIVNRSSW